MASESEMLSSWRWRSPLVQTMFVSSICASTAGLYVAINGLGAGGGKPTSQTVASQSNSANDAIWVFSSLLGGVLLNKIGPAYVLAFGAAGFPIYISGFWIYDQTGKAWVPVFMSALTGCTAGALWAVQNWVATFYPEEGQKGRYIFVNWSVIKTGAVIGSLIALGLNANRTKASVAWQLYLIYFLIMVTATIAAFFVAKPETVRRNDGTALARFRVPTLKEEMVGIWEALKTPQILLMLLPLFVAESYLAPHSSVNGYTFTLRARSLNNVLYWFIEIPAGFVHFKIADATRFSRRTRAFMLTTFVGIVVISGFIGAMVMVTESDFDNRHKAGPGIDWTSDRYGSRCFLYIVWGAGYGLFFQLRLWFMGTLSNEPTKLARYCSLVPALQAAGITIAFGIDAVKPAYWKEFTVWLILFMAAFGCLYYLAAFHIIETNYFKEDAVIVPVHVAIEHGKELPEFDDEAPSSNEIDDEKKVGKTSNLEV